MTKRFEQKLTAHFRGVMKVEIRGMFVPSPLYTLTVLCPDTVAIDLSSRITARIPGLPLPFSRTVWGLRLSGRRMLSSGPQYSVMTPCSLVDSYELLEGRCHPHITNFPKV